MNLRRKAPSDSLYLLLDTLCNAFGGIILLAVLVVLLTSKEKIQSSATAESQEMLQRQLIVAQANLQHAQQLTTTLQAKSTDTKGKEQMQLLAARKDLQDQIQLVRANASETGKELETANASDPADRMKYLKEAMASAEARKQAADKSLAAANEDIKRVEDRMMGLKAQIAVKLNEQQRELRLPKEHESAKQVMYLIVQYGKVYPCRNADSSRNETDIHWTITPFSESAEPISTQGIDPVKNPAALRNYFKALSGNSVYVVFCAFEDSFPAFLRAKEIAVGSDIGYGWDPLQNSDAPVTFSAFGSIPKAQ